METALTSCFFVLNQFHDILPGSCIAVAHDQSIAETTELIRQAGALTVEKLDAVKADNGFMIFNPLGVDRSDVVYLPIDKACSVVVDTVRTQMVTQLDGSEVLAVAGLKQKPLSFMELGICSCQGEVEDKKNDYVEDIAGMGNIGDVENVKKSAFSYYGDKLETPYASVTFDEKGFIAAFIDKRNSRELCNGKLPLNAFVTAEDVPAGWDNWDIDADCLLKLKPDAELVSRSIAADGEVEFRIRSEYRICRSSKILQDMIFYADSPLVVFDTRLEWQDKHRLLKVSFDTTVKAQYASHEIQFGNIKRPTTRNNSIEQAMFEVCNHKYTDLINRVWIISV